MAGIALHLVRFYFLAGGGRGRAYDLAARD